jgi:hypothetical protein
MRAKAVSFDKNVFINCPFDEEYAPLFRAIVFSIQDSGFLPRCALEAVNAGESRFDKILEIISDCKYAIHDLSRTELDQASSLPRFNMPLELGLDLGCKEFGRGRCGGKSLLILDKEVYRYQKFISDLAGRDVASHSNSPKEVIMQVRKWLRTESARPNIASGQIIYERYLEFELDLPKICGHPRVKHDPNNLAFADLTHVIFHWLSAPLGSLAERAILSARLASSHSES